MGEVGRVFQRIGGGKTSSPLESGNENLVCKAGENYVQRNSLRQEMNSDQLDSFLDALVELVRLDAAKMHRTPGVYFCGMCRGFLVDPVTLPCGHSSSKSCIPTSTSWNCPECGTTYAQSHLQRLKTNVTISTLLEKWWPTPLRAAMTSLEGDKLYQEGNAKEAIRKFTTALELDPSNYLAAFKRSVAFLSIGQTRASLRDADQVVMLNPLGPEGYLHRGIVLVKLREYELALSSFLQCFIVSPASEDTKIKAKQSILETLSSSSDHSLPLVKSLLSASLPTRNLIQKRKFVGSEGSLFSADSMESLCTLGEVDSDDDSLWLDVEHKNAVLDKSDLLQLVDKLVKEIQQNIKGVKLSYHKVNPRSVDKIDFECPLCMRLLLHPVTTPCGHTFCCACLERCLDYQSSCPLCKTDLYSILAERKWNSTKFIDYAIQNLLPEDYAERKQYYEDEMKEHANAGKNLEHYIPLFICTVALPTVPCPLHIFEPRYRLMIRQCMESGSRQFGMCAYFNDDGDGTAAVGTMLRIRNIVYLPDGRSIVDTVGARRFRILKRGMRDGYHTAAVEFLHDEPIRENNRQETMLMYEEIWKIADLWFKNLPCGTREKILFHFGPMPSFEENCLSSPDGPSWLWWVLAVLPLESKVQLQVLGLTSCHLRLDILRRVFLHIQESDAFPHKL